MLLVFLEVNKELLIFNTGNFKFGLEIFKLLLHDSDLFFGLCDLIAPILIPLDLSINIALSGREEFLHSAQQLQVTGWGHIIISSQLFLITVSQLDDTELHVHTYIDQTFT